MANIIRYRDHANSTQCDFLVEYSNQIADLPTTKSVGKGIFKDIEKTIPEGSTCMCANGVDGKIELYILFAEPINWKKYE